MRKNLIYKIVVNHKMDLIDHPYFILLEICKLDLYSKREGGKARVINAYDNQIRKSCT